MAFTPIDIEKQKFDVRMRGYDCAQVSSFLSALAEHTASLVEEKNLLEEQATELRGKLAKAAEQEKRIQETILALRDLMGTLKEEARREAEVALRDARAKGDQILKDARAEALRIESQISHLRMERDSFEDRLRLLLDEHERLLVLRRQESNSLAPIGARD